MLIALWTLRELVRTAWGIARGPVIAMLHVLAALVVLFEEWGWKPLSELLGRLARFGPVALVERGIARLPPYGALAVFTLPVALLFPLKFVAMWLLARGEVWVATLLFVVAKIASTAIVARIFTLTKPQLMEIPWFARLYNAFVPWKEALFEKIRASRVWRGGRLIKVLAHHAVLRVGRDWRSAFAALRARLRSLFGTAS